MPTAVCKLLTATVVCGRHATGTFRDGEYLVFKVTTHKVSIVLKRDFGNLTTEEIRPFAKLVNEAKLDELTRWQSLNCFRRMWR